MPPTFIIFTLLKDPNDRQGFVPLPKSVTPSRIEENADIFDFKLSDADMAILDIPGVYEPCAWDPTVSKD